jgi:S1-C subfamily serine protease
VTREIVLGKLPDLAEQKNLKIRGGASADNILGIGARDLNQDDRDALGMPNVQGVLVVQVNDHSPARQNGIQEGDVLVRINSTYVHNIDDFNRAVSRLHHGSFVRIAVQRGSMSMTRMFRLP